MITKLVFHHSGGIGNNSFASSQRLSFDDINRAHRNQWPNFPSELDPSIFIGYTGVIFPDRFVQTRLLGEELAANKGYNKETIAICIMGNFTKLGNGFVDTMTQFQKETAQKIAIAIFENRPQDVGLKVKAGYQQSIGLKDIIPHRFLNFTECYGTGLPDSWGRDLVIPYIKKKILLLQQLLELYIKINDAIKKAKFGLGSKLLFGATPPHSCLFENNRG